MGSFKDAHMEKALLNNISTHPKSINIGIWLVGWYIKSNLYTRFLNWNKIFEKKVTGKTPFFVIGLVDFNAQASDTSLKDFCDIYSFQHLIKELTS